MKCQNLFSWKNKKYSSKCQSAKLYLEGESGVSSGTIILISLQMHMFLVLTRRAHF